MAGSVRRSLIWRGPVLGLTVQFALHPVFPNLGQPDSSLHYYREALVVIRRSPLADSVTADTRRQL